MSFVLRRSVLACLATLGAVLAPAADAQEVTVKVGAVRSISTVAILWAAEKGYFKEYGIKVATETLDTAANSIALLAQNQLQLVLRQQGDRVGGGIERVHRDLDAVLLEVALLGRADGLGAGDQVPARPRPYGGGRHAYLAARPLAHGRAYRCEGRLRPDLAVRDQHADRNPRAGAATV